MFMRGRKRPIDKTDIRHLIKTLNLHEMRAYLAFANVHEPDKYLT